MGNYNGNGNKSNTPNPQNGRYNGGKHNGEHRLTTPMLKINKDQNNSGNRNDKNTILYKQTMNWTMYMDA